MKKKKRNKHNSPTTTAFSIIKRDAKEMQTRCKIAKNSERITKYSEEEKKKMEELKNKIREISELLLKAAEEFARNEDYKKYINIKRDIAIYDENGRVIKDKAGNCLRKNVIEIDDSPYVRIDEVNKAINAVNKITKILHTAGILQKIA